MTVLRIDPGVCGLKSVVRVGRTGRREVHVKVQSECEAVNKLNETLGVLTFTDIFVRMVDNPVYRAASVALKHASCPVPSGILKAAEVELELALPRDVSMIFVRDDEGSGS